VREIVNFTQALPRTPESVLDRQLAALDELWSD
jgi:hypothetical protein